MYTCTYTYTYRLSGPHQNSPLFPIEPKMELLIGVLRFSVSESMTISEKMVENQTDVKMKLSRENSVKDNVNDNNNTNNNNNNNNNNNSKSNNNSAADANDILPVSQMSLSSRRSSASNSNPSRRIPTEAK